MSHFVAKPNHLTIRGGCAHCHDLMYDMLSERLHGQPYNEQDAEAVLQEYLRIYQSRICKLCASGIDREDVEQELRIALWQAWTRWDGRVPLRRWLSWKLCFKLRDLERDLHKKRHLRYPLYHHAR